MQRNRAEYFGRGKKPWEAFEDYWRVSPLRYINNAKTPTLIHVVDGEPRVPRTQSEELHMALKQRGVPTEFFVYPGNTHGIPDARNQYLKAVAEFTWFEKWIRGKPWFTLKELLATLEEPQSEKHLPAWIGGPGHRAADPHSARRRPCGRSSCGRLPCSWTSVDLSVARGAAR